MQGTLAHTYVDLSAVAPKWEQVKFAEENTFSCSMQQDTKANLRSCFTLTFFSPTIPAL